MNVKSGILLSDCAALSIRVLKFTSSVIMGADYYETIKDECIINEKGLPSVGIGRGSVIRNAILTKMPGSLQFRIINEEGKKEHDGENYSIRDGSLSSTKTQ